MLRVIFIISFVTSFSIYGVTQIIQPFSVRFSASQKGGIKILSNIAITCNSTNSNCSIYQNQIPPNGNHNQDGGITMGYVDVDMDASTWMSSSDSLNLPILSEISWAGLYWSSRINSNITNYTNRNQVRIKVDNGAYVNLTADNLLDLTSIPGNPGFNMPSYYCFKDITSIVQPVNGNARFTIANVVSQTGSSNLFGTWTIVIVYKNSFQSMRNLTVFDGMAYVSNQNNLDIPVSGFTSPTVGPVSFEFGIVAYEGDRNIQGDRLQFNGNGTFLDVPDPLRNSNDFFNSSITSNGSLTPYRDPSYNNTLGLDVGMFNPNNSNQAYLPNNATSATIRVMTTQDAILPRVITSSIDILETFDISATTTTVCAGQPTTLSVQSVAGTITALNCGSATNAGTLTSGIAANGVSSSVPFTGGNGGTHNGQTVASSGVTGLTATLTAGTFASGNGSLTYTITGTPSASGTASFALNIGGQTCALSLNVEVNVANASCGASFVHNPNLSYGTVVDQDGNTYKTIVIGSQEWMSENLKTSTYSNGEPIPNVTDPNQWSNVTTGAWAHYNNDSQNECPYGKLYNWHTLVHPSNVCPAGWHVPTDAEWNILTDYLGGPSAAGGKMKSTGTQYWLSPNTDATNQSGFSGLPGGYRAFNGNFYDLGSMGWWWREFEGDFNPWNRLLSYQSNGVSRSVNNNYNNGFSVRCLKD